MFKPVDSKVSFPEMEERVLQFWREREIFRKSVEQREGGPTFIMYEGPPTANGTPGIHHVLARVFKDIIPRYKTMQGYQVPRKGGWDTHGLPVELEIERELGLKNKRDIEEYGIEKFNQRCRESVFRYVQQWERMTERIGFWIDMDQAYVTYTNDYIETGWWIIKQLWNKGLVYLGYKTTPHCPRCGTSLSSHEVALGYDENTVDPSIYVKFRLARPNNGGPSALFADDTDSYIMAWTTTPWTLPGNTALAVAPDATYVVVERRTAGPSTSSGRAEKERIVLAQALLAQAMSGEEYQVVGTLKGAELIGLPYEPLYDPTTMGFPVKRFPRAEEESGGSDPSAALGTSLVAYEHASSEPLAYRVIGGDFVSMEDGTGVVHIAPAFGEDDFNIGKEEGLFFIQHVDLKGEIMSCPAPFSGMFVKTADPLVIRDLEERGLMHRSGAITHTYPFCWRCDTPLLYYVKSSWYLRTTALKDKLIEGNRRIAWYPGHIQEGRFGDWLENNVDWAISRERYWGTPLPVWQCQGCGATECVGSRAELSAKPGVQGYRPDLDLHRPYVDAVTFTCEKCGGTMRRQLDVMDAWFDSGAMPFSQWHFPFENQETFQRWYPADYICEAVDQTRGWFYTLHALATLMNGANPELVPESICYRHVICLGHILDAKGEKMSKSRGNVVDPWGVLNSHGADALRWYLYTASPAGQPRRFSADLVGESLRRFMLTLWNTYSFFVIYANIDNFTPAQSNAGLAYSELDRWVLSELNQLVQDVTDALESYNPTDGGRRIQDFVEDLSNWYVRRSRRRFWKSENDSDKLAAYNTLYTCLVTLSKLLAPFTPFVAEEMYQNLVRSVDAAAPESVHLSRFPTADAAAIDEGLNRDTRLVMRIASLGRAARSKAGVKVRQPLKLGRIIVHNQLEETGLKGLEAQILDELNLKGIVVESGPSAGVNLWDWRVSGDRAKLGPKYGRRIQEIEAALKSQDARYVALCVKSGNKVGLPNIHVVLEPDEVTVEPVDPSGYAVAEESGYVVAISTEVTPELAAEGLARELVHRIQTMRRSAGFDIADFIETWYEGDDEGSKVMAEHRDYISQETLSRSLLQGTGTNAYAEEFEVDGHKVRVGVKRV